VDESAYPDAATDIGVLRGVVEKVREHLLETRRIAADRDGLVRKVERQSMPALVDDRSCRFHRARDQRGKHDRLLPELDLAARDPRDIE
jgi:hypothetical protein